MDIDGDSMGFETGELFIDQFFWDASGGELLGLNGNDAGCLLIQKEAEDDIHSNE